MAITIDDKLRRSGQMMARMARLLRVHGMKSDGGKEPTYHMDKEVEECLNDYISLEGELY
jgi:hypothetical protein